jgi:nucleolar protein 14
MGAKKNKSSKHKRSAMKDKVHQVNPFELKINRQKYEILGRKISKTEKGMPGVARSKALKKVSTFMTKGC